MNKYWENGSGYYDSTAKKAIDNESKSRNKLVHDSILEIKNILRDRDLILVERIVIKDKKTKKIWR